MRHVQPMANASNATPIAGGSGADRPVATIVIPAWNAWEHTERCLQSLRPTLGRQDQVVVVDNGSTDGTRDSLKTYGWLEVVANDENQGFARGCNQGAAKARGGVVVFLNSDTVVPSGWLDELLAPFETPDVGAVGPCSDNVSGRQKVMPVPDPREDPDAFAAFAEGWRASHGGETSEARRLVGFCLAVRTSSFHAVGGFDERFEIGGFEDDDLCRRLHEIDLRLLIAHGSFVHHSCHASFEANDIDWRVTQLENQVRFEKKWGPEAQRRPVLLTACLIVKNEEQMLAACLESVRDAVDEIVVYDTGSNDRTMQIAREAGATVVEGEWEDSFAAARNAALRHATGEWVLSIDADERLQTHPDVLRAQLADPHSELEAYLVAIENLHGPGNPRSVHTAIRMFRRRATTWRHRLHEQIVAADDPARHLRTAYLSGARLIHHGYIAEIFDNRNKADRNLELARAALDDGEVGRSYALMNLGRALESAGHSEEAVARLSEAADSAADTITRRLAVSNLVYILGRIGRFEEALSRLKELRRLSRSQVAADIAEGRTRLAMGETEEGLALLARIPSRGRDDDGMEYGPHVVAAIRGEALASLGRYGEAADVVLSAVRSDGVLEADVGELVHWLLQAERSPAEITAALGAEDLVPMLGRVLRQAPPLADVLLDGAWAKFPDRLEPLAAAASVAPRLPLARALVWSARLRQRGLTASCPVVAICADAGIDPVVRVRAAAALYGSFHDLRAVDMARAALRALDPTTRLASEEEIGRLAPTLLSALTGAAGPTQGVATATRSIATEPLAPGTPPPSAGSTTSRGPTGKDQARMLHAAADHQARGPEHRRSLRRDQRRSRCGPPAGRGAPRRWGSDIDDLLPPRRPGSWVGVVTSRILGLPLRGEPARGAPGPDDRLRPRLGSWPVPGSLHDRAVGVGSAGTIAGNGRRGTHGARGVDSHRIGMRERLLGVRRAGPLRPRPGRWAPVSAGSHCTGPAGRRRVRVRCRLRQRIHPAEPAGSGRGLRLCVLATGRPPSRHGGQSRRPVPPGARSARRLGPGTSRCGDLSLRSLVCHRAEPLSGVRRLLSLAAPGRWWPRGRGQSDVMGNLHGCHGVPGVPGVPD